MRASVALPARVVLIAAVALSAMPAAGADDLRREFASPPDSARPWVYLMVADGHLGREGLTADLEAMRQAGIGGVIMMETNVGVPRGTVDFMSPAWREAFAHGVKEAERLGLHVTLNAGPGWTGSGGPWVKPEQSMQHLVAAATPAKGPARFDAVLARAQPRPPYFGSHLPAELEKARKEFYRDVAVLAFPTPKGPQRVADIDEKALYVRDPYTSKPNVRPRLPSPADAAPAPADACVPLDRVMDLTEQMDPSGRLTWDVPAGEWTILRLGRTSTGANTRPAPHPGLGLECDKMNASALDAHFDAFIVPLLKAVGPRRTDGQAGWTHLHIDSWEMGSQNWTADFREQFRKRRGCDPLAYLPAYSGYIVRSPEVTERFLWDVRLTSQELVIERHARHLKELGRRHGFGLSIEPYDMNPCGDMVLGSVAGVPMGEFWADTFDSVFSCIEAVSIAHTRGRAIVAAEAFTSGHDGWRRHPGTLKQQADWALCMGINRIVFHRYQHQAYVDRRPPGLTFGGYGVHWERTQTWWPLAGAFHAYLARCQHMLRQGAAVADVLYLTPEGAPQVFTPPASALRGSDRLRDKRGYSFDGCDPDGLIELASVKDGRIIFPGGASYRLLVLGDAPTMTPRLMRKVVELVEAGANVVGSLPVKSPSLEGYPECDSQVMELAKRLEGKGPVRLGKGVFWPVAAGVQPARSPEPLAKARWIWHGNGNAMSAAAGEKRFFRRMVSLKGKPAVASAAIALTADNAFSLRVNGREIGEGDNFTNVYTFDLPGLRADADNLIEVEAVNQGDAPNPAGLIGSLRVRFADGSSLAVVTDAQWHSAATAGGPWTPARDLGPMPMGPWNLKHRPPPPPELYPDYGVTARILHDMGVGPDFESDLPLRCIHRRDGGRDIYFVSNTTDKAVTGPAAFRVTQAFLPETHAPAASAKGITLWDPMTGRIYRPPAAPRAGERRGTTLLDLTLPASGSVFVVFHESIPTDESLAVWKPLPGEAVVTLDGPWEVTFPPNRGAPPRISLPALLDLSCHRDPAVRHFSGIATYRRPFTYLKPAGRPRPAWLDLGEVNVAARVRLNGRDLGIAWKSPYLLELGDALREGENTLEIDVANLWINRLIGDAALPADKRVTWTTWSPYKPNSPLAPSGLIGPVHLKSK